MAWLALDLPHGLNQHFALPYAVVRSAIFASQTYRGAATRPQYTRKTKLSSYGAVNVYQTAGEQLDQSDGDVFAHLIKLARVGATDEEETVTVRFNADEFLADIQRAAGGSGRRWLKESISRLKGASFLFDIPGLCDSELSLVSELSTASSRRFEVLIDLGLSKLFAGGWTLVHGDQRYALRADPLAQFLHAFYASHRATMPLKADTLRDLAGRGDVYSETGELVRSAMRQDKWLKVLAASLANLHAATGWYACRLDDTGRRVVVAKKEPAAEKKTEQASKAEESSVAVTAQTVQAYIESLDDDMLGNLCYTADLRTGRNRSRADMLSDLQTWAATMKIDKKKLQAIVTDWIESPI